MNCNFINQEYMSEVYKRIAQIFRNEREKQNITIAMLEKKSGIDKTAIYKMEKNKRRFGFENLIKMCYVLDLKLDDLYYVEDSNKYRSEIRRLLKDLSEDNCLKVYNYILKIKSSKNEGVENYENKNH